MPKDRPVSINHSAPTPPGGWRWRDPETGRVYTTKAAYHLIATVEDVLTGNGRPAESKAAIEKMICEQNDYGDPYCLNRKAAPFGVLSIGTLSNFVRTVMRWLLKTGGRLEDMTVVQERADVCAECPRNKPLPGCQDCPAESLPAFVVEVMLSEARRPANFDKLKNCLQCGCRLSLKIQLPGEAFKGDDFKYPPWCWMNKL